MILGDDYGDGTDMMEIEIAFMEERNSKTHTTFSLLYREDEATSLVEI